MEDNSNNWHKQQQEFRKRWDENKKWFDKKWEEMQKKQDEHWAKNSVFKMRTCIECKKEKDEIFATKKFEDGKIICNPCYYNPKF